MSREISGFEYKSPRHLPARFKSVKLADVIEDDGNAKALEELRAILSEKSGHSVSGLTLVGANGTGKTMMACALLNEIVVPGFRGAYVSSDTYVRYRLEHMKGFSYRQDTGTEWQAEDNAEKLDFLTRLLRAYLPERHTKGVRYDILVLDDLGREHHTQTGFAEDELDYLIRSRFDLGLMTICTSNRKPAEWNPERPALGHLVREACPPVLVLGTDYRERFDR